MLRKLPETMQDLDSTIMVLDKLAEMVAQQLKSRVLVALFAQYMAAKIFTFDEAQMVWNYADKRGLNHELTYLESDVEKAGELYFMFNAFREKSDFDGDLINIGFMVLEPKIFDYIEGDNTVFEKEPINKLVETRQLAAYTHKGFWQCMDTVREKEQLEKLWNKGQAPWKVWEK
jgi:hypothetical protein